MLRKLHFSSWYIKIRKPFKTLGPHLLNITHIFDYLENKKNIWAMRGKGSRMDISRHENYSDLLFIFHVFSEKLICSLLSELLLCLGVTLIYLILLWNSQKIHFFDYLESKNYIWKVRLSNMHVYICGEKKVKGWIYRDTRVTQIC